MADKVQQTTQEWNERGSRTPGSNGNRVNPKDNKARSDAQHGQTDEEKSKRGTPTRSGAV